MAVQKNNPKSASAGGPKRGPPNAGSIPTLPDNLLRLIDGETILSIRVEYSKFSTSVEAKGPDGKWSSLEEVQSAAKAAKAFRLLSEESARYAERIVERSLNVPSGPPEGDLLTRESLDKWLRSLGADTKRFVTMTNRDFRAQQGTNDDVSAQAEKKTPAKAGETKSEPAAQQGTGSREGTPANRK